MVQQKGPSQDFLGFGITRPFRRDRKGDFASARGAELVISAVGQVIGTRGAIPGAAQQGEVKWRTQFGSLIHTLRHAPNVVILRELARNHVLDSLKRWEPRVIVKAVDAERVDTRAGRGRAVRITVRFNLIAANVPGNLVVFPKDLVVATTIPLAA